MKTDSVPSPRLTTWLRAKAIRATFGQTTDRRDYASMPARIHGEPMRRDGRKQLISLCARVDVVASAASASAASTAAPSLTRPRIRGREIPDGARKGVVRLGQLLPVAEIAVQVQQPCRDDHAPDRRGNA